MYRRIYLNLCLTLLVLLSILGSVACVSLSTGIVVPENLLMARDVALAYLAAKNIPGAPQAGLSWEANSLTGDLVGKEGINFQAEEWTIAVTYPNISPEEDTNYTVRIENPGTGFSWQCEMNAQGGISIPGTPMAYTGEIQGTEELPEITPSIQPTLRPTSTLRPTLPPTFTQAPTKTQDPSNDIYQGWTKYTNQDYGFGFYYPPTWSLEEIPEQDFGDIVIGNFVGLHKGEYSFYIGYARAGEGRIFWTSMPHGDESELPGLINFFGQPIKKQVLMFEGKIKVIYTSRVTVNDLVFALRLDSNADYDAVDIPIEIQEEMDRILATFELLG